MSLNSETGFPLDIRVFLMLRRCSDVFRYVKCSTKIQQQEKSNKRYTYYHPLSFIHINITLDICKLLCLSMREKES